jgi:hypothetical protein
MIMGGGASRSGRPRGEERFVDVGAAFPSGAQSFVRVEPGQGAFDHPPVGAQAGAVWSAAAGDHGV